MEFFSFDNDKHVVHLAVVSLPVEKSTCTAFSHSAGSSVRCCWTENVWINAAVTTVSLASFFHMKHFKLTYRRHHLSFGLLDQWMCMYLHAYDESEAHKFSNMIRTNGVIPIFTSTHISHTRFAPSHTHTHSYHFVSPAAVYFHNITSCFTHSHYSILKASSPTVVRALRMCRWHQVCQIFTILNYPAAGMPLRLKISCSH